MKKYSYLIFHQEHEAFLERLRSLGVVHIRRTTDPSSVEPLKALYDELKSIGRLKERMQKIHKEYHKELQHTEQAPIPHIELPDDVFTSKEAYITAIEDIDQRLAKSRKELEQLKGTRQELLPWGDFDPSLLQKLRGSGYYLHFWQLPSYQYDPEWEERYGAVVIDSEGRSLRFVTVSSSSERPDLPAEHVELPLVSLSNLDHQIAEKQAEIGLLESSLAYLSTDLSSLSTYEVRLTNRYNFDSATIQGTSMYDDKLIVLEGWVPEEQAPAMEAALDAEGYAFVELEITEGESVPIKLKGNALTRAFQPLIKMFSLPNYYEFDPTAFVAPFFMLFFGICFGDAGYGLLVLVLATLLKHKVSEDTKPVLTFAQWLGGAGLVVGFFTGSFFGIELVKVPFLQGIRQFFISSDKMMYISVAIGFIHVLFAKVVAAFKIRKQKGTKYALSSFAWVFLIVSIVIMLLLPKLFKHTTHPPVVDYILYGIVAISVLLIVFYNSPGKNVFINVGSSIWQAYNTVSGLLGDTLSYIRLFAIGLTGAILGNVFNTLAVDMTASMPLWIRWLPMILILFLGHGINISITTISALVHPVRLIFVEYFNNSDYEGGGEEYSPLREITK